MASVVFYLPLPHFYANRDGNVHLEEHRHRRESQAADILFQPQRQQTTNIASSLHVILEKHNTRLKSDTQPAA
jgi:hypothetical protein